MQQINTDNHGYLKVILRWPTSKRPWLVRNFIASLFHYGKDEDDYNNWFKMFMKDKINSEHSYFLFRTFYHFWFSQGTKQYYQINFRCTKCYSLIRLLLTSWKTRKLFYLITWKEFVVVCLVLGSNIYKEKLLTLCIEKML